MAWPAVAGSEEGGRGHEPRKGAASGSRAGQGGPRDGAHLAGSPERRLTAQTVKRYLLFKPQVCGDLFQPPQEAPRKGPPPLPPSRAEFECR